MGRQLRSCLPSPPSAPQPGVTANSVLPRREARAYRSISARPWCSSRTRPARPRRRDPEPPGVRASEGSEGRSASAARCPGALVVLFHQSRRRPPRSSCSRACTSACTRTTSTRPAQDGACRIFRMDAQPAADEDGARLVVYAAATRELVFRSDTSMAARKSPCPNADESGPAKQDELLPPAPGPVSAPALACRCLRPRWRGRSRTTRSSDRASRIPRRTIGEDGAARAAPAPNGGHVGVILNRPRAARWAACFPSTSPPSASTIPCITAGRSRAARWSRWFARERTRAGTVLLMKNLAVSRLPRQHHGRSSRTALTRRATSWATSAWRPGELKGEIDRPSGRCKNGCGHRVPQGHRGPVGGAIRASKRIRADQGQLPTASAAPSCR